MYKVQLQEEKIFSCNCLDYQNNSPTPCKHMFLVERILNITCNRPSIHGSEIRPNEINNKSNIEFQGIV